MSKTPDIFKANYSTNVDVPPVVIPNEKDFYSFCITPSINYYYLSKNGHKIPYIAQEKKEVEIWATGDPFIESIYYRETRIYDIENPEKTFMDILQHYQILSVQAQTFKAFLKIKFKTMFSGLNISDDFIEGFMQGGISPAADFFSAIVYSHTKNKKDIQDYLDWVGVTTFTAQHIVNLSEIKIYFYLTRFYSPPPYDVSLQAHYHILKYSYFANTLNSQLILKSLIGSYDDFILHKKYFDEYFYYIASGGSLEKCCKKVECTKQDRFIMNIFDYLKLLAIPKSEFNITIFKTIMQTDTPIKTLLDTFSDEQLDTIVYDKKIFDISERYIYVEKIVESWSKNYFYLDKKFGSLCKNKESLINGEEFIEIDDKFYMTGNILTELNCFTLEDLLSSFIANTDETGYVSFKTPFDKNIVYTLAELVSLKDIIEKEETLSLNLRGINLNKEQILEKFNEYIFLAQEQESEGYQILRDLKIYTKQNSETIIDLFMNLFYLGMYFRQWKGPPHPYPLNRADTGVELSRDSEDEVNFSIKWTEYYAKIDENLASLPQNIREKINGLTIYKSYKNNAPVIYSTYVSSFTFQELYTRVKAGDECIRMSSTPFVFSAAYYLKVIANHNIEGFQLDSNIVEIQ